MIITICGSMQFVDEMDRYRAKLQKIGHTVFVPIGVDDRSLSESNMTTEEEKIALKVEYDFIREHFSKIQLSDAILVLNFEKNGISNYIGGNTFLEIGLAFYLKKNIFLVNPIPAMDYSAEMHAMQPVVLNDDLSNLIL